jgi:nicotinate-nucleotide--dimethylbenzimidazole phosphoribosyltransferase
MFPNVRMMIVAVVASVVTLSFVFGVLATFLVSHQPLGRMTSGAAQLQLAADDVVSTGAAPAVGETFGSRSRLSALQTSGVVSALPAAAPDRIDGGAEQASAASMVPSESGAADMAAVNAPSPLAEPAIAQDAEAVDLTTTVSSNNSTPEAAATTQPADQATAPAAVPAPETIPADEPSPDATAPAIQPTEQAAAPAVAFVPEASTAVQPIDQTTPLGTEPAVSPPEEPSGSEAVGEANTSDEAATAAISEMPAATPETTAAGMLADQAQPIEQFTPESQIVPEGIKEPREKTTAKKARHKSSVRQRVAAKVHRVRKARPRVIAQAADPTLQFMQPNSQSAVPGQQAQPATRRRVAKSSGVGGPFVRPPSQ